VGNKDKGRQVVVITGASSGIGRATALEFARHGGNVILASRSREVLEEVAKACKENGGHPHIVQADVSKEEEVKNIAEEAIRRFGKIDVWVNNAAVIAFGGFEEMPDKDFRRVLDVNLFGYVYGARAAIHQFRKQGQGKLINVSSVAGVVGQPFAVPYSISKFGIRGLGISLDQELKNEKNIHVSTVMLSTVDTPIYEQGANYIGKKIAPPVTVTPPQEVAREIFKLSKKSRKNVFIGNSTWLMRLGRFLLPTLFDKITYWKTIIQEFEDQPVQKTKGNLYEPVPEKEGIRGGWLKKKKKKDKVVQKAAITTGIIILCWILKQNRK
jgi:NAD(P)-dependent dehydrogenase (short-subunit alcohol dehydrogenase family)